MKRIFALAVAAALCVSMAGCTVADYAMATKYYKDGEFAEALTLYQSLGDFADSEKMADICAQKADYVAAQAYFTAGQYDLALPLYQGLGMYADSPLQAIVCQYRLGLESLDRGEYLQAISYLEPLGNYEDSLDRTNLARWLWLGEARHTLVLEQEEGFAALSCEPVEAGKVRLLLEQKGLLLGLPYEMQFTMTLTRNQDQAEYTLYYESVSETTVLETASGTVALGNFAAGGFLPIDAFTQTRLDLEGEKVTTDDVSAAIMVPSLLISAQAQINTSLPQLLEKSGVDISPADLGL